MTNSTKKRGPVSREEKQLLNLHLDSHNDEELAKMIDRTPEWVAKYRIKRERPQVLQTEKFDVLTDELHKELFWPEIEEQFTALEQKRFSNRWITLCHQFGDSIVATDKMQMVDLIRQELLVGRILKAERMAIEQLDSINKELDTLRQLPAGDPEKDLDRIHYLMTEKNQLIAVQGSRTRDIKQMDEYKSKLFSQLKSTRDQRIDKIQDTKMTFFDLLKSIDKEEDREREGRTMELVKLAASKAAEDLSKNLVYADGNVDRPIYNSETAALDNEEKDE